MQPGDPTPAQLDPMARQIFTIALSDNKAGELLACLFDGGSATVDMHTGQLVMLPSDLIQQIVASGS